MNTSVRVRSRLLASSAAALIALIAIGCAPDRGFIDLTSEESSRVGADHVRLVAVVPERKVNLTEQAYKVLWSETQVNSYSFDSLWDPAPWLEEEVSRVLKERWKIDASPLRKEDPEAHKIVSSDAEKAYARAKADWKERRGFYTRPADESVRALRKDGARYLFEVHLTQFFMVRGAFVKNRIGVVAAGRLVRLDDGVVVWHRQSYGDTPVPSVDSFADFEKDDLALLKRCFQEAVANLLRPDGDLLQQLGPAPTVK